MPAPRIPATTPAQNAALRRQVAAAVTPDAICCYCCGQNALPPHIPGTLGLSDREVELIDTTREIERMRIARLLEDAPAAPWWRRLGSFLWRVFVYQFERDAPEYRYADPPSVAP
jgi:hypothetical protein